MILTLVKELVAAGIICHTVSDALTATDHIADIERRSRSARPVVGTLSNASGWELVG